MSGDKLRDAAMTNDHVSLEEYIKARASVCSADEWGLTALHYAVWNGHEECVKLLAFNSNGVDMAGQRTSCLEMKSCIGLSALHLAAMDCPADKVLEITRILLIAGADPRAEDDKGRSAYYIAREQHNQAFLDSVQEYVEVRNGSRDAAEYTEMYNALVSRYQFFAVGQQTRQLDAAFFASLPFIPPDFLKAKQRVGQLPAELSIHEHQIIPLAEHAFHKKKGVDALKTLQYAQEQAEINQQRRERLVNAAPTANP